MRVLPQEMVADAKLLPQEKYFLELWYSMTHMQSLDSYRVRCMNSRTIIRELSEELDIGIIKENEFKNLCAETKAILENDPIILHDFPQYWTTIKPYLESPPSSQKKKTDNENKEKSQLQYVSSDFFCSLEKAYFEKIIAMLPGSIRPDNGKDLKVLVDALIGDLLDRGWPLETLFGWHRHFLVKKPRKDYTFQENLNFMLKVFTSPPIQHQVTLRLQGSNTLGKLNSYGDFSFVESVDVADSRSRNKFQKKQGATFAQTILGEVDALSAAIRGREKFEQLVDLLRFDLEPAKLRIDPRCYVKRLDNGKEDFPAIHASVPNPSEKFGHDEFVAFAQNLDTVCNKSGIEASSRRQLQAAIRQYRFGRDSENYNDKFLNWWMGLEALSRVGNGKEIGATVACNVSRAMAVPYLHRLVRDLATTLKFCRINWPAKLVEVSGCDQLEKLTLNQLVTVLQSGEHQLLWDQCEAFPTVCFRGKEIGDILSDPKKTAGRMKSHLQHLEWHLERLYRIRCCIVHGAPVRFRLGLLAANLEYYLKQVILLVLNTFRSSDHVGSLAEFFDRASFAYDRAIKELDGGDAGVEEVRSTVNLGFVL